MREIKLRYWDKEKQNFFKPIYNASQGQLEEIILMMGSGNFHIGLRTLDGIDCTDSIINRFEISQSTGLLDKEGKEIFEGDINEDFEIIKWCNNCVGYSLYLSQFNDDKSDYCMNCGGEYDRYEIKEQMNTTKIIGNIYQDKNLIT